MIEALVALHLSLQKPPLLQEARSRVRYYRRVKKPRYEKLEVAPPVPRVELLKVRPEGTTFDQEWNYRVCVYFAEWTTHDSLQCTW